MVVISRMAQAADEVRSKAGVNWKEISSLGIGTPGPARSEEGHRHSGAQSARLVQRAAQGSFEARFPVKVLVGNDANVAAFGE